MASLSTTALLGSQRGGELSMIAGNSHRQRLLNFWVVSCCWVGFTLQQL
ncbi:MAG: hypothetical protein WBD47_10810 [Phormidesmis sp.]